VRDAALGLAKEGEHSDREKSRVAKRLKSDIAAADSVGPPEPPPPTAAGPANKDSRRRADTTLDHKPQKPTRGQSPTLPRAANGAKGTTLRSEPGNGRATHTEPGPHRQTRTLHEMPVHAESPGPVYFPDGTCNRRKAPEPHMGTANRFGRAIRHFSPGPVYYCEKKWRDRPVSFSKGSRFDLGVHTTAHVTTPAPTDYLPDHNKIKRQAPGFSVPSASRGMDTSPSAKARARPHSAPPPQDPAAGDADGSGTAAVEPKKKKKGKRIIGGPLDPAAPCTFGRPYTKPLKPDLGPGPGAYHKPEEPKGKAASLKTSGRDYPPIKKSYDAGVGMYTPNYTAQSNKPRAPNAICYLNGN